MRSARFRERRSVASGKITEYPTKTPGLHPHGITVSPEGIVWFWIGSHAEYQRMIARM